MIAEANDQKSAVPEFSFDWIIKSNQNRLVRDYDLYSENGYDIVLVTVKNENGTHYEAGNPLLGGVKHFKSYKTANKYFYELIGRVHRDAISRKKSMTV